MKGLPGQMRQRVRKSVDALADDPRPVRPGVDCIEDSAKTMVQIRDLGVISGLYDFRQLRVDGIGPDSMSHVRDLFIQVIFLDVAENQLRHSLGIVHSIERNWRS